MKKGPSVEATGYGTSIADGFLPSKLVRRDLDGGLSAQELGRAAANVTQSEAEVAKQTFSRSKRRKSSGKK